MEGVSSWVIFFLFVTDRFVVLPSFFADDFVGANYGYPIREGPCGKDEMSDCDEGYEDFNHPIHYSLTQW